MMCFTDYGREKILAATIPHIEKYPTLYGFTSDLLGAANTSHADRPWPLTVRHAALHMPPDNPGEETVAREHRVFLGFQALLAVDLMEAVGGVDGKVRDRGDWLQLYELKMPE